LLMLPVQYLRNAVPTVKIEGRALQKVLSTQAKHVDAIGAYLVSGFYTFVRDGIATPAGIRGSRQAELIDALGAVNQLMPAIRERFVRA
jgi:hypothetical protein